MTDKELNSHINDFVNLNPRKLKYPKINNKHLQAYLLIQQYFKNHYKEIKLTDYDNIFYNQHTGLGGKEWINILLSTKNVEKYYKLIRIGYPYCNQKMLKQKLLLEIFYWSYSDVQESIIEIVEQDFNIEQKNKLKKIRQLINEQEWSIYFFELQKIMHEQIIFFLDWIGNFNYDNYSKILIKKLNHNLNNQQTEKYLNFIKIVNLYRNTFSKIKPSENDKNQILFNQWNNWTILIKKSQAWDLYYQLNNFINVTNLILQEKKI